MDIREVTPGGDDRLARVLLSVQRAAYAVEAAAIGDDRIPPLHETLDELRSAPLRWLAAFDTGLVGAIAWAETNVEVDVHRLVVDPASHRRGVGRALVRAVLVRAGHRHTVVATGRANVSARALYDGLGFVAASEQEVIPHLWVTRYVHDPAAVSLA
ncbi:GNAT family N-acetyltransferase [Micromonospora psammae]|uniref:GNAT family N-acetyltransferase n=1 Tax=Micromonospora sp. CPCC 205556 TaxID=3122398 RepID=UPI002FF307AD